MGELKPGQVRADIASGPYRESDGVTIKDLQAELHLHSATLKRTRQEHEGLVETVLLLRERFAESVRNTIVALGIIVCVLAGGTAVLGALWWKVNSAPPPVPAREQSQEERVCRQSCRVFGLYLADWNNGPYRTDLSCSCLGPSTIRVLHPRKSSAR